MIHYQFLAHEVELLYHRVGAAQQQPQFTLKLLKDQLPNDLQLVLKGLEELLTNDKLVDELVSDLLYHPEIVATRLVVVVTGSLVKYSPAYWGKVVDPVLLGAVAQLMNPCLN